MSPEPPAACRCCAAFHRLSCVAMSPSYCSARSGSFPTGRERAQGLADDRCAKRAARIVGPHGINGLASPMGQEVADLDCAELAMTQKTLPSNAIGWRLPDTSPACPSRCPPEVASTRNAHDALLS